MQEEEKIEMKSAGCPSKRVLHHGSPHSFLVGNGYLISNNFKYYLKGVASIYAKYIIYDDRRYQYKIWLF